MEEETANLALPYIMPSQAQKHVTHNEALRMLDALVQLAVADRDLAAPPGAPAEGSRYLVAAGATGAWAGQSGRIAAFQDGAWSFLQPREGWLLWIVDEAQHVHFTGSAWIDAGLHSVNPTPLVGVNATAALPDRLVVRSAAALFDHEGGDHRLKVNKAAAGNTASVLFQTGYSGRAEFGLAGSDDWQVKVSPNGSAWVEALRVNAATGRVLLPAALALSHDDQAVARRHVRERLTAARTYYVRSDGSDANGGLANSAGGAFATIAKALTVAAALDCSTFNLTVKVGDGTWTEAVVLPRMTGSGTFTLEGNTTTPASCVLNAGSAGLAAVLADAAGVTWAVNGFEVRRSAGNGIDARYGGRIDLGAAMRFHAVPGYHVFAFAYGLVSIGGGYAIVGGAAAHWAASRLGLINTYGMSFTLSGTPAFGAFAAADSLGAVYCGACAFSGAATGARYAASKNAIIDTAGGGASVLPGNAGGSTSTGGVYA